MIRYNGPNGDWEQEITEGVFSGSARDDNPRAWRHGTEVLVPHVSAFGNRDDDTGDEDWEPVPAGSALEGYLLPQQELKDGSGGKYRLLKLGYLSGDRGAGEAVRARAHSDRSPVSGRPGHSRPARDTGEAAEEKEGRG